MDTSAKLPNELWYSVLGWLDRKSLKSVCLVNKHIGKLARPALFEEIAIDIGDDKKYASGSTIPKKLRALKEISEGEIYIMPEHVKRIKLIGISKLHHEDLQKFLEPSPPSLFNFFPNLRVLTCGWLCLDEKYGDDMASALFDYICSHGERLLVCINVSYGSGNEYEIRLKSRCLERLGGLHSFGLHFMMPNITNEAIEPFSGIINRSPGLEALKITSFKSANLKLEDILSKVPNDLILSKLKVLDLEAVVPPSTLDQIKLISSVERLFINTKKNVDVLEHHAMWSNIIKLGVTLTDLRVDNIISPFCDFLVSKDAMKKLKRLRIALPYSSGEPGDLNHQENGTLSEHLWQIIPHALSHLEHFTLLFDKISTSGLAGSDTPHQCSAFGLEVDTLLWSIQQLEPHLEKLGPMKLKSLEVMATLAENDKNLEWARTTSKVLQRIMSYNSRDLRADVYLMTESSALESFLEEKQENKLALRRYVYGGDFKKQKKRGVDLLLKPLSVFCAKDENAIESFHGATSVRT